jgi:hypothetical protein
MISYKILIINSMKTELDLIDFQSCFVPFSARRPAVLGLFVVFLSSLLPRQILK